MLGLADVHEDKTRPW